MFIRNKYTNIYYNIIERAKSRVLENHSETHHIVPRSLGGDDSEDNLVVLTPREHYLCHALLPKMCKKVNHIHKMYAAFNMMHLDAHGKRYTGRLYEYYKIKFYKLHSENQKGKPRWTEADKKRMSEQRSGVPWSDKARAVVRNKPTAKPVLVYKKDTEEFVGEWESITLCAKELGCDHSAIWKICKGDWKSKAPDGKMRPYKSHKGYTFQYKN